MVDMGDRNRFEGATQLEQFFWQDDLRRRVREVLMEGDRVHDLGRDDLGWEMG